MPSRGYSAKKLAYSEKLANFLISHTGIILVGVDNVGSNQLQQIRSSLRGRAEVLMGKNTQIRRVIREVSEDYPDLKKLLPHILGNIGLVFTNEDIKQVRDILVSNRIPAAAKAGTTAPTDVFVPPGPTGLDPGQTSFFQALGIATKIARGSIEIITTVHLIKKGDRVGNSEVALLAKLDIKPFTYGLIPVQVYDTGAIYAPEVLDITDDDMRRKFFKGVSYVAAVSLALGFPTVASVPHSILGTFKKLIAIAVATEYTFAEAQSFKDYLANPDAFKAAEPEKKEEAASAAGGAAAAADEDEDSEEDVGGGGLFGDASDGSGSGSD